uniref:Uncharacterized protein n=1 Tax=Meloidogyne floridensis TaxID=298350 RepID=A0A915NEV7_9BILA
MDNNQQQQLEIENKEKESPKDSGKKKVKFETSSDSSGDDFEMVQSAKNDGVIKMMLRQSVLVYLLVLI